MLPLSSTVSVPFFQGREKHDSDLREENAAAKIITYYSPSISSSGGGLLGMYDI
jgi:hypothetical protein